ncbi:MAG: FAD-dependent oxidoreductase [Chloroflexi bacterium]|nr:FAD-dependent oxidoreductase [Chloroflexota bacterium]
MSQNADQATPLEATRSEPSPPCVVACPVHTDVRGYIHAIARGDFEAAYAIARAPNPFVYVCGRICAQPCEEQCRRGKVDEPMAIRALKRFATEQHDLTTGHGPPLPQVERKGERIAIIGAGPAGLTAAHDLARMGYQVTVFEAHDEPGGMLRLGLPKYRLPREVIDLEVTHILQLGVELKTGVRIGTDLTLSDIKAQGYKAIFIAIGGHKGRGLRVEGVELEGVLNGVDFLRAINTGQEVKLGKRVIVIGGGNVAVDVARSAARLAPFGEREILMMCLECREEMPAHEWEIEEALKEGIQIYPSLGPKRILGRNGRVTGVETIVCCSVFDEQGRFNPAFTPGTESVLEGDTVILAIGQASDLSFIHKEDGIEISPRGTIVVDKTTLATTAPGIFAGGEVTTGPDIAISAIAQGHRAARSIDAYLRGIDSATVQVPEPEELGALSDQTISHVRPVKRNAIPSLPLEKRSNNFNEVELGYTEVMAVREALRCLTCGAGAVVDTDKCAACLTCVRVCPYEVPRVKTSAANIAVEQCQACGICASECPAKAITLRIQSEEEMVDGIRAALNTVPLNGKPRILGFVCRYCVYGDGQQPQSLKVQLPDNVALLEVLCTCKVDVRQLLRAFEFGADAVYVVACREGDCHHTTGARRTQNHVSYAKKLLGEIGLGSERLDFFTPDSSPDVILQAAEIMAQRVLELGSNSPGLDPSAG